MFWTLVLIIEISDLVYYRKLIKSLEVTGFPPIPPRGFGYYILYGLVSMVLLIHLCAEVYLMSYAISANLGSSIEMDFSSCFFFNVESLWF
jgi:hypothetical protein